jgi:hypothetical protein
MTLTFTNENDVIIFALDRIIQFAKNHQYLFVANCAWWIAGVIGLESGLITLIDNLESRRLDNQPRGISSVPRDIAREVSPEITSPNATPERLRQTRSGRVNPLPQTKTQLKKARKRKRLQEAKEQLHT